MLITVADDAAQGRFPRQRKSPARASTFFFNANTVSPGAIRRMSCRSLCFAFAAAAAIFAAGPASAARIVVTIDGVHSDKGNVLVGLYASPAKFLHGNQTDAIIKVKASTGPITVTFNNLKPGTYAVGAFHDENSNNHLDTNAIGFPSEGFALSNGIRPMFSRPDFYEAAFTVDADDKPVELHIKY
jgi:uncharacterized protein (DUF2141 family)